MEKENIMENISINSTEKEKNTKIRSRKPKDDFKEKECEVINYNQKLRTLDIRFDGYGIRIKNIECYEGTPTIIVKYKGEIGKQNFNVELG